MNDITKNITQYSALITGIAIICAAVHEWAFYETIKMDLLGLLTISDYISISLRAIPLTTVGTTVIVIAAVVIISFLVLYRPVIKPLNRRMEKRIDFWNEKINNLNEENSDDKNINIEGWKKFKHRVKILVLHIHKYKWYATRYVINGLLSFLGLIVFLFYLPRKEINDLYQKFCDPSYFPMFCDPSSSKQLSFEMVSILHNNFFYSFLFSWLGFVLFIVSFRFFRFRKSEEKENTFPITIGNVFLIALPIVMLYFEHGFFEASKDLAKKEGEYILVHNLRNNDGFSKRNACIRVHLLRSLNLGIVIRGPYRKKNGELSEESLRVSFVPWREVKEIRYDPEPKPIPMPKTQQK